MEKSRSSGDGAVNQFVERCGAVNPNDGSLCQLPKGHQGNHNASGFQQPPTHDPQPVYYVPPPRRNNAALGCLGVIALIVLMGTCSRLYRGSVATSTDATSTPVSESAMDQKALPSAKQAAERAFLSDAERAQYSAGLTHIKNIRGRLGSYTIAQVIALGATPTPAPTPYPYIGDGDPPCLKLLSQHGENDGFAVHITGSVVNTCDHDFRYVQIVFKLQDSSGAVVGNATGNALDIAAGQTWAYKAIGSAPEGSSNFNMTELTGH